MHALFTIGLLLALAPIAPAYGSEVWVDAIHGDDGLGLGTETSPFQSITRGVAALAGIPGATTVHVAPGTYDRALGESFPIQLKPSMSILGSGTSLTFVSGEGWGTLLRLRRYSMISDLTVMRAGRAVECTTASDFALCYLRRCVLCDSTIGLHCADGLHQSLACAVVNSSIVRNKVGVHCQSFGFDIQSLRIHLYGSTVTDNGVGLQTNHFGPLFLGIFGSILRGNEDDSITGWWSTTIQGSVLGDPAFIGVHGNIDVDPAFAQAGPEDVHLSATSPVLDNPSPPFSWPVSPSNWIWEPTFEEVTDLDGNERLVGGALDPGADEVVLPTLYVNGRTQLGTTFMLGLQGDPADRFLIYAAESLRPSPGLGFLWLAPPLLPVASAVANDTGITGLPLPLPADSALAGIDVYLQAFRPTGSGWQGSAPVRIRLLP